MITVAIVLAAWAFPRVFSFVSYVVLYPIDRVVSWYSLSNQSLPVYLRSRTELANEMEELKRQIANQASTHLTVQRLINENMQLRAVAEMGTTTRRIAARVIAQPTKLRYDYLQIDQGSLAGVMVGAPVFVGVDTAIGVVVHTAPTYSFVELVTTPGFLATAYVVGPNIFASLEGIGGGVARVKVPQGVSLQTGNIVLLPGVESGVYGEIVAIDNVPTQPEQYGYVTPPVPLKSLLYVSVGQVPDDARDSAAIDITIDSAIHDYFRLGSVPEQTGSSTGSTTTEDLGEVHE